MGRRLVVPQAKGANHGTPSKRTLFSRALEPRQARWPEGPTQAERDLGDSCLLAARRSSLMLSAGENPVPARGGAASPGIESWAHGGNEVGAMMPSKWQSKPRCSWVRAGQRQRQNRSIPDIGTRHRGHRRIATGEIEPRQTAAHSGSGNLARMTSDVYRAICVAGRNLGDGMDLLPLKEWAVHHFHLPDWSGQRRLIPPRCSNAARFDMRCATIE